MGKMHLNGFLNRVIDSATDSVEKLRVAKKAFRSAMAENSRFEQNEGFMRYVGNLRKDIWRHQLNVDRFCDLFPDKIFDELVYG